MLLLSPEQFGEAAEDSAITRSSHQIGMHGEPQLHARRKDLRQDTHKAVGQWRMADAYPQAATNSTELCHIAVASEAKRLARHHTAVELKDASVVAGRIESDHRVIEQLGRADRARVLFKATGVRE